MVILKDIKSLRKPREKHILNKDGTITAYLYDEDIFYLKDNKYEEIDNTLIDKEYYLENKNNSFLTNFSKNEDLVNIINKDYIFKMKLDTKKNTKLKLKKNKNNVYYTNIIDDIDINYEVLSNKLKESIILKNKDNIPNKLVFNIDTNLTLEENNNIIIAKDKDNIIYKIDKPFMLDANNNYNYNSNYNLKTNKDNYVLTLYLDKTWLKKEEITFPVIIDPTLIVNEVSNIFDTFIYEGDTNINRNTDVLKVGTDSNNKVYRTLLKFNLPIIGTGSTIIDAKINLVSHISDLSTANDLSHDVINAYKINTAWEETTANWITMNDKYDSYVEGTTKPLKTIKEGNTYNLRTSQINITNLVKKWYTEESNYGVILKRNNETYRGVGSLYSFYSKTHNITSTDPKPVLEITYRNQNGLENYMSYESNSFADGDCYINKYNGNLTTVFDLNDTVNGKFPVNLSLVYNTNDIILNKNYGYGVGYKLSLHQLIKEVVIDDNNYVEYLDADGTLHYFYSKNGKYIDQDGLGLELVKENNKYYITDKDTNKMIFEANETNWYLKEIIDTSNNKITITYDNNKIIKVTDANMKDINLTYNLDNLTITSDVKTTILNYTNNKITSLVTKNGTTLFSFNNNNLIDKITDITGKAIGFTYYSSIPYKISRITEYGLNNNVGKYLDFNYGFDVTTIVDNKNHYNTYTFNSNGNVEGITNLNGEENLYNGYGTTSSYIKVIGKNNNKLVISNNSVRYVKNYIYNSSFERPATTFTIGNTIATTSNEYANTGNYSLKINNETVESSVIFLPTEAKTYTFSAYIKNDTFVTMKMSYLSNNNGIIEKEIIIAPNLEFKRYSLTLDYPGILLANNLYLSFSTTGIAYVDDVQLEEGTIANYYNLIDNSDFSNYLTDWVSEHYYQYFPEEIPYPFICEYLENGKSTVKINSNPDLINKLIKEVNISGSVGDIYNLSFWYKNRGIKSNITDNESSNYITMGFDVNNNLFSDELDKYCLNIGEDSWQFFSEKFIADKDYSKIKFFITSEYNANDLYITNVSLLKDLESDGFVYDDDGNLISIREKNKNTSNFNYDNNNQLISMFNTNGSNFKFEYDNNIKNRVLQGMSPSGITNEIVYDNFNNPVKTIIKNVYFDKDNPISKYYIRLKGTKKYLKALKRRVILEENTCSNEKWLIEKVENNYRIKPITMPNHYLGYRNNQVMLRDILTDESLFTLISCKNGSYLLKPINETKYICSNENSITTKDITENMDIENDNEIQFFIENSENLEIESNATYTSDGKVLEKTIDSLYNETDYDINPSNNLTNSVTGSKNNITNYTYNTKEQLTSATKDNTSVNYTYNTSNLLSKIATTNKEYNFTYDDFLNTKQIKVGTNTLITNNYEENNGNLINSVYGNNNTISYTYDDLNRLKTTTTMNNTYTNYYNNLGSIGKIISNNDTYKYNYDFARRLSSYNFNNFKIDYDYDSNNNISKKIYKLNNSNEVDYTYNLEDTITKVTYDNNNDINYVYDNLGRVIEKNINGNIGSKTTYSYITNGNKTSMIINMVKIGNDTYNYKYDKMYNITSIYKNNNLINKYEYDKHYELIKEDNYILNKTIRYKYDNEGNILSKKECYLDTYNQITNNTYTYNDTNWKDKLTKFNEEEITYDNIGNPLTIGNKTLTWINGRSLNTYSDTNLNISYKYNKDGIRIEKIVNNIPNKYYVEQNKIIVETRGNNVIYYLRDEKGNLEGIKYNNNLYYYLKNIQNDIIGLLDSNLNKIASYEYDSWGNIISIKDNNNNEITDETNIALINPYRYRSYYYDNETKLYYLNSRYYNPLWGRFINEDITVGKIGTNLTHNMFSYALNNPINMEDDDGNLPKWIKKNIGKIAIGLAAIAVGVIVTAATGGAALPALIAGVKAAVVAGGISATISTAVSLANSISKKESLKTSVNKAGKAAIDGFSNGFVAGGIMAGGSQVISAGFKLATNLGVAGGNTSGINLSNNIKILSPNANYHTKDIGGTIFKIGNNFRIDVGSKTLLHAHSFGLEHIPFGVISSGIYGGLEK